MSDVVVTPVDLEGTQRRTAEERFAYRFPRLYRSAGAAALRHSAPRSKRRRRMLARGTRLAFGAFNRGELEFLTATYWPESEFVVDPSYAELGINETGRGPAGARAMLTQLYDAFSELRWESPVIFDGGDRLVILMFQVAKGHGSGVEIAEQSGNYYRLENGRIVFQRGYRSWEGAFEAAGFPESLLAQAPSSAGESASSTGSA